MRRLLLALMIVACDRPPHDGFVPPDLPRLSHEELKPVLLQGEVLSADTNFTILVDIAVANDSQLVVVNFRQPYLRVIDRRTGAVVASLGRGGSGPGEYVTDPRIGSRADGRSLWVHDMQKLTLTRATLDPTAKADSVIQLARFDTRSRPMALNDSTVLFVGARDTMTLAIVDFPRAGMAFSGTRMTFGSDTLGLTPVWRRSIESEIAGCLRPDGQRIVRFYRESGRLEYLSRTGELMVTAQTPYQFETELEKDVEAGWARKWYQRNGYGACVATDSLVFALFSGRHEREYKPPTRYFPSEANAFEFLHVFDWNGKLVKVIQLAPASWWSMAIDPKTLEMFGLTDDPDAAVVRYDLRAALNRH